MKPTRKLVQVNDTHIENSHPGYLRSCAVSSALKDMGFRFARVCMHRIFWGRNPRLSCNTPRSVRQFMRFTKKRRDKPFNFFMPGKGFRKEPRS